MEERDIRVERFFRGMAGRRIAILGVGISNIGLARLFAEYGAAVTACDKRDRDALGNAADELVAAGASLRLGEGYLDGLEADVVFRTPGMNFFLPELVELRKRGVVVTSEMEVFFDLCPCLTVAVTGSDGKTTTTTLIAEMLKAEGRTVHLGGNLGKALLPGIRGIGADDIAVVELSSFQLISMRGSPDIAVITNVAPNHLDVHKDMAEYIAAKQNLYRHQNAFSRTVLNLDDGVTASFIPEVRGRLSCFSMERPVANGACLDREDRLCFMRNNAPEPILPASEIRIPGRHNAANYLAAIAAVEGLVSAGTIRKIAREFGGVEHRIEFVRELDGVKWYNDSIATSPTRAIAGLLAFDQTLTIIAGGYDKKIPFEPLAPHMAVRAKLLILTGDTAAKIEAAVTGYEGYRGSPRILRAADLAEAVAIARRETAPGDVVSLSPASASFDRYPNFEARGRHFKDLVMGL